MLSRVSYRFEINSSYTCGRAKTLRVDASIFENGEEKVAFSNEYGYVWTGPECSPIRSVIIVINKNRGSPICFITSMITNRIGQDEVRLPIHHNYNKICDILGFSSIIKTRNSKSFFLLAVKTSHLSARMR